jgi:hypothetical protein
MNSHRNLAHGLSAAMISYRAIVQQLTPAKPSERPALGGLFRRKEKWTLTAKGWIVFLLTGAALLWTLVLGVHPFLAVTQRTQADVLVVEGWIPAYALAQSWPEFQAGHYRLLLTVGTMGASGPGRGPDDTYASWAADRLRSIIGQKRDEIHAIPARRADRDRTYASAVALDSWLQIWHPEVKAVNVVTISAHARRSRLLFEKALRPKVRVGVIAIRDPEYDPAHWWRYSEGVKEVVSEGVAYLYARFLFHPGNV